jgi:acid phosphatase (class A)
MGRLITQRRLMAAIAVIALALGYATWRQHDRRHYLTSDPLAFAASFEAPSARDSAATRNELDALLSLQSSRTPAQISAARADRKTEVDRFFGALGLDPVKFPDVPHVRRLAERVEDDVRIYVRAVKYRFKRLRPYEIEPRIEACISDVRGDLSYPSGHAAYGYAMAALLTAMVPERGAELLIRAEEFARQRMICGVHFQSDLAAGKAAASKLMREMSMDERFTADLRLATTELRAALALGPVPLDRLKTDEGLSSVRWRRSVSRLRKSSRHAAHVSCRRASAIPRTCAAVRVARR